MLGTAPALASGCGGDDGGGGGGGGSTCHCSWGDSCDEYSAGCAFQECESNGMNVKSSGACPMDDVIGTCTCASESLVTYYTSQITDPQGECDFWCDDGVYQPL